MGAQELVLALFVLALVLLGIYSSGLLWRRWMRQKWGVSPLRLLVISGNVESIVESWLRLLLREWSRMANIPWDVVVIDRSTDDTGRIVRKLASSVPEISVQGQDDLNGGILSGSEDDLVLMVPLIDEESARRHLSTLLALFGRQGAGIAQIKESTARRSPGPRRIGK